MRAVRIFDKYWNVLEGTIKKFEAQPPAATAQPLSKGQNAAFAPN
jgi:hypothetical protein